MSIAEFINAHTYVVLYLIIGLLWSYINAAVCGDVFDNISLWSKVRNTVSCTVLWPIYILILVYKLLSQY